MKRTTKKEQVLRHLIKKKSITSWDAIQLYGATRLSAIIFNLRDAGYLITTNNVVEVDRNGNTVTFARYVLAATPNKIEENEKAESN